MCVCVCVCVCACVCIMGVFSSITLNIACCRSLYSATFNVIEPGCIQN